MIPEFPLPPNEADFYHSKLYERPPLFGVFTRFELPEVTLAQKETVVNPIGTFLPSLKRAPCGDSRCSLRITYCLFSDLTRPLKMAEIRCKQHLPTPKTSRTFSKPSLLSTLTNLTQSLAYT